MRIGIAEKQGYTQVYIAGALGPDSASVVREEMDHLLSTAPMRILLDLNQLEEMSEECFCELARALVSVRLKDGQAAAVSPPPFVREYLEKSGLGSFVETVEDLQTAVRALLPAQAPRRSEFVEARLLGEILVDLGVLDEEGLRQALEEQRRSASEEKLGSILLRLNIVTPAQILSALETQYRRRTGRAAPPTLAAARSEFVRRNLLGEILQEAGVLDDSGLETALAEQRQSTTGEKLGDVLLRLKIVTPEQLLKALETQARR